MKTKYEELPMIDEADPSGVMNEPTEMEDPILSTYKPSSTEETKEMMVTVAVSPEKIDNTPDIEVSTEDGKDKEDNQETGDEDLKSKYVKLIEHNSRLVDLLKTTMQIQTDMFRKLIHYVFP